MAGRFLVLGFGLRALESLIRSQAYWKGLKASICQRTASVKPWEPSCFVVSLLRRSLAYSTK